MGRKSTRTRHTRRDRRKAKASNFAREGTKNPKKIGHHSYSGVGVAVGTYMKVKTSQETAEPNPKYDPPQPPKYKPRKQHKPASEPLVGKLNYGQIVASVQPQQQQPPQYKHASEFRSLRSLKTFEPAPSIDDLLAKYPSMGDPKEFARKDKR